MTATARRVQKRADHSAPQPASALRIEVRSRSGQPILNSMRTMERPTLAWQPSRISISIAFGDRWTASLQLFRADRTLPGESTSFEPASVDRGQGWLSGCADRHPPTCQPIPRLTCSTLFQLSTQPSSHSKASVQSGRKRDYPHQIQGSGSSGNSPTNVNQQIISLTSRLTTMPGFLPFCLQRQPMVGSPCEIFHWRGRLHRRFRPSQSQPVECRGLARPCPTATAAHFRTAVVSRSGLTSRHSGSGIVMPSVLPY